MRRDDMVREKVSLNVLAMESTCRLLSGVLQKGVNLQQVHQMKLPTCSARNLNHA